MTLNMGQILSIPLVLGGIGLMIWLFKTQKNTAGSHK